MSRSTPPRLQRGYANWMIYLALLFFALALLVASRIGANLQERKAVKAENKQITADLVATGKMVDRQQQVIADSSRRFEEAAARITEISREAANERAENQIQMALIRSQLEDALAARPDLADVHVGNGVLEAWNGANAGRAAGSAGAAQPAAGVRPKPAAAGARKPAPGKGR